MSSAPYLFDDMNADPPKPRRRRHRTFAFSPKVKEALSNLENTLNAIPASEWEVRERRWEELQRDLKLHRAEQRRDRRSESRTPRSAALMPGKSRSGAA